jgi:hypothetical protein
MAECAPLIATDLFRSLYAINDGRVSSRFTRLCRYPG